MTSNEPGSQEIEAATIPNQPSVSSLRDSWNAPAVITAIRLHPLRNEVFLGTKLGEVYVWGDSEARPRLLTKHATEVLDIHFAANGSRVVTRAFESGVRVIDLDSEQPATIEFPHPWLCDVAQLDVQGQWLVTGCRDGAVRVWSVDQAKLVADLQQGGWPDVAFFDSVTGLLFSAKRGELMQWHLGHWLHPIRKVDIGVPIRGLLLPHEGPNIGVVSGHTCSDTVVLLDRHSLKRLDRIIEHKGGQAFHALGCNTAGTHVVTIANRNWDVSNPDDGIARLWNMRDGRCIAALKHLGARPSRIRFAAFASESGSLEIVTISEDGRASRWAGIDGQRLSGTLLVGADAEWLGVSHCGRTLFTVNRGIRVQRWQWRDEESGLPVQRK